MLFDVKKVKAKLRLLCKERLSPSCVRGRPLQLCAQRVYKRLREIYSCVHRGSLVCAWLKRLKRSAAECVDQNCDFEES